MDMLTDARIIAVSMDEPHVFAHVFDRHFYAVRAYLARRVEVDVAVDLAAEVFTVAFDARRRYDPDRSSARPWLLGIATNLLRHHRRGEVRRLNAIARMEVPMVAGDGTDAVDARIDAQRLRSRLADALAHLSPGDRDVLLLHAWADLSHADIGLALGIPAGTVRSRLHRARGRGSGTPRRVRAIPGHGSHGKRGDTHPWMTSPSSATLLRSRPSTRSRAKRLEPP